MDPQKYCLSCEKEFVRKSKGWKRFSLRSCKITPSKFSQDGFLCHLCANKVKCRATSKKGARKRVISTPAKPTAKKTRQSFTPGAQASKLHIPVGAVKDKAVSAIHSSHYEKAISCLLQCKQGRAAFDKVVTKIIRKETKSYPRKASLSKDVTVDNITHWNWGEISDEAEVYLPVLTCALKAALPDPATRQGTFLVGGQKKRLISVADATMQRNQRLCMMLAITMYSCQPRVFNFLQGCLSIQLWKHGCSQSLLSCLQNLGLTKGPSGTIGTIDRVRKGSMEKLQSWKKNIEIQHTGSKCSSSRRCLWMTDAGTSNLLVESTDEDDLWGINEHGSAWEDDLLENETAETNHHSRDVATDGRDREADEDKSASNQNESVVEVVPLLTWEALQNESDEEGYNGRDGDLEASDEGDEASNKDDKSASDQDGPLAGVVPLSACEAACSKSSDFNRTSDGSNPSVCTEPGYSVVWDNVQIQTAARHESRKHSNKFRMWALTFAARNRVSFAHELDMGVAKAQDVPLSVLLPSASTWNNLRERMAVVLEGILKSHLVFLKHTSCSKTRPHKYAQEMSKRSEIVNLGVVEENPSSTPGTIRIMEYLHKFVPSTENYIHPIPCFGDGLSVERMNDSKRARAGAETSTDRFEGLVQCPQEFHHRGLILQDTVNKLFTGKSATNRGTLFQLKQDFGHRSMKKKVMDNFSSVYNLVRFSTEAYATLLAMKLADIDDSSVPPVDFPSIEDPVGQTHWLKTMSERVVDFIWPDIHVDDIAIACSQQQEQANHALQEAEFLLDIDDNVEEDGCMCDENTGESMIRCSNLQCGFFHYSCANVEEPPEGDWWCSTECKEAADYIYCSCHKRTGQEDEMVQCELQERCTRHEWYHLECIHVNDANDLPDKWYCCLECKKLSLNAADKDCVLEYSKSLLYQGLYHETFRHAIREGNGPAIIDHWRLDMLTFWNNNHHKYLILAHNMLVGIHGFYPPRVAKEIVWNRVANLTGKKNGNIGLDLVNEFLNKDYKEMLARSRGVYSKEQVQRCSQVSGAFGRDLDEIFMSSFAGRSGKPSRDRSAKFQADVQQFCVEYKEDGLFDFVQGRQHSAFPKFHHSAHLKEPAKLGKKLLKLSQTLDSWRGFVQ